ncbi:PhnA domain-containing protein [Myroides sp. M-43]|uniref:PhnA domain-containing protein n=1 Tax=Myroides oncorhynchi TaxID=2893756 RepID=UPI001E4C1719|nr:alkylphosphonate utilization protein [Myroides oncorhynchi]MCC9041398.1 PhnA domain-containing protein [Myroides oncorhynchi]
MKTEAQLKERSGNKCELCEATGHLNVYDVPPAAANEADKEIYICDTCLEQVEKRAELDPAHWQCLTTSMWSEYSAVQVVAWRMLNRFRNESWAADSLEMMYLGDELLEFAKLTGDHTGDGSVDLHKDCNGNILVGGDTVTLIKDLDVKGSTINAKIGTAVRNIRLVHDNTEQIEGKIDGQQIVILTKFVKKQA